MNFAIDVGASLAALFMTLQAYNAGYILFLLAYGIFWKTLGSVLFGYSPGRHFLETYILYQ